jgi:hypothetical protein
MTTGCRSLDSALRAPLGMTTGCRSLDSALRAPLGMTVGVIPSERSDPAVIPSERSESRDPHS